MVNQPAYVRTGFMEESPAVFFNPIDAKHLMPMFCTFKRHKDFGKEGMGEQLPISHGFIETFFMSVVRPNPDKKGIMVTGKEKPTA